MKPHIRRMIVLFVTALITVIRFGEVTAQSPFEIRVFIDQNAFTVYVPPSGAVALGELAFQVVQNSALQSYRLQDFAAFGIDFQNVPTPLCFRLLEAGANTPLPTQCPPVGVLIQSVSRANVFWYDGVNNVYRTITVMQGTTAIGICPSGISDCPMTLTPPTSTPTQTTTNTPTITPAPEFTTAPTLTPTWELTATPTSVVEFSENEDLVPFETWLFVEYQTANEELISAWVNAQYVEVRDQHGRLQRLADLQTIPSDRSGEISATTTDSVLSSTDTVAHVMVNPGVSLHMRLYPRPDSMSLALAPSGAEFRVLGREGTPEIQPSLTPTPIPPSRAVATICPSGIYNAPGCQVCSPPNLVRNGICVAPSPTEVSMP